MSFIYTSIQILSALLTPIIAIAGACIAFFQWRTNDLKRKNDLFDRRYGFYQSLRAFWLNTANLEFNYELDLEDLIPFAEEATFLFGNDISNFIISLDGKSHTGSPYFPNEDFISPFRKYLQFNGTTLRSSVQHNLMI